MKPLHLLASAFIIFCTCLAWLILGQAISVRTHTASGEMQKEVSDVWGPQLSQSHPEAFFFTPNAPGGKAQVLPESSKIDVTLISDPKKRGLMWHRTYDVNFAAEYVLANPTPVPQTLYIQFPLPSDAQALKAFIFELPGSTDSSTASRHDSIHAHGVTRAILLAANAKVTLRVAYKTRGSNTWTYTFGKAPRIRGFLLTMHTNFDEIDFPPGTGSPTSRQAGDNAHVLTWDFPDVIEAPAIGMDMPNVLNAGPIAMRMALFAPVSLLFFFSVLLLVGMTRGIQLHPMHVFFTAAGFFAFHLLFAYLVDLLPLYTSFLIAAAVSLFLVGSYLRAVGGKGLFRIALPAQFIYLVLYSFSFFFDGLTGIAITAVAILTLATLMLQTARLDWSQVFQFRKV